jgi:single-strand DNA-binding protein
MNKCILLGNVVKDPEMRFSQGEKPISIARYSLAVERRFKRDGEPTADFVSCVALGKQGEFAEKFLKKGTKISVVGRLQVRSWDDNGTKRYATEVIVEEHYFAGGKSEAQEKPKTFDEQASALGFGEFLVDDDAEDSDLPF